MTSMGTLRDLDQAVDEAFSEEPACEYSDHPRSGTGPAAWYAIRVPFAACGCPTSRRCQAFCPGCRARLLSGGLTLCNKCRAEVPAGVLRWEPIR